MCQLSEIGASSPMPTAGVVALLQLNMVSKRMEYRGEILETARAIIDIPCGGQVWCDAKTFAGDPCLQHQLELVRCKCMSLVPFAHMHL